MDDRSAHFLTMVGDTCIAAGVGDIRVELLLSDGSRLIGAPSPEPVEAGASAVGETGYADLLLVDGCAAQLRDVVEFVVRKP